MKWGAGAYVASYASKAEQPDQKLVTNIIAKNLARINPGSRKNIDVFRAFLNGVATATSVGMTQVLRASFSLSFLRCD